MTRTGKSHAGRVNLTKYVKVRGAASETWRFCPVVHTSNGRIRPDYVLIDGRPELHKEGAYYIEWYRDGWRYRESVGKSPSSKPDDAHAWAAVWFSGIFRRSQSAIACGSKRIRPPTL